MTESVFRSARGSLGTMGAMTRFRPGERLVLRRTPVETVPTSHDGVDGAACVVGFGNWRLRILTDLGHIFAGLLNWSAGWTRPTSA